MFSRTLLSMSKSIPISRSLALASLLSAHAALAQYTPWVEEDFPMHLYWGDTHLHSAYSVDANTMGNLGLRPDDAYRFARGETVVSSTGVPARLHEPLDFLVVSDHAEQLGIFYKLREGDARLLQEPKARSLAEALAAGKAEEVIGQFISHMNRGEALVANADVSMDVWRTSIAQADAANTPGVFSALIGFEWTSMPDSNNLHRVVVYADDGDKAGQLQPVSSNDGEDPAHLWSFMEEYEQKTSGRILAIPHNGNLSNGRMFETTDYDGKPIDEAYAKRRARLEPIVEVTQIKGDGEAHPFLSPDDEFADFETWDGGNFAAMEVANKKPEMLQHEYARSALKLGLDLQRKLGSNPFQFGMIGSTDAHTSLATADEDNFYGKATALEPGRPRSGVEPSLVSGHYNPETELSGGWTFSASGYTAVWARDNTREEIFNSMQRREVYATSGPRIGLRFFGGWNFSPDDIDSPHMARIGYRGGVPMGGELGAGNSAAPTFLIAALKDPHGANLERVQMVKGWIDAAGQLHEKVYTVSVSDNRKIGRNGKVKPLKHTVDLENATYSNSIGDEALSSWWQDPDFDPAQAAFYYVRVLEIPVPRWSVYDAVRLGRPIHEDDPQILQDRAYSSPIWYNPPVKAAGG